MWLARILIFIHVAQSTAHIFEAPEYCDKKKPRSPLLWKVRRNPPSYFFGTIHVPYTEVWEHIQPAAKTFFRKSDFVFFELDFNNPYNLRSLEMCQFLPKGERLAHQLPSDLYQMLTDHLEQVRKTFPEWLPTHPDRADYLFDTLTARWELKRPIWILFLLQRLTQSAVKHQGIPSLDLYLTQEAEMMSKMSGEIEKVEEHCDSLNSLNLTQVIFLLNQTLTWHRMVRNGLISASSPTDSLIVHYNCGDLDEAVLNKDAYLVPHLTNSTSDMEIARQAKTIDAHMRREIIGRRNINMADRVFALLNEYPDKSFFFAFGAAHFLGPDGVVELMKTKYRLRVDPVMHKHQRKRKGDRRRKYQIGKKQKPDGHIDHYYHPRALKLEKYERWNKKAQQQQQTSATPNKDRNFNELWVRMKGFSPKPWDEVEVQPTPNLPQPASSVQFNHHYYYIFPKSTASSCFHSNSLALLLILIALILCCQR